MNREYVGCCLILKNTPRNIQPPLFSTRRLDTDKPFPPTIRDATQYKDRAPWVSLRHSFRNHISAYHIRVVKRCGLDLEHVSMLQTSLSWFGLDLSRSSHSIPILKALPYPFPYVLYYPVLSQIIYIYIYSKHIFHRKKEFVHVVLLNNFGLHATDHNSPIN